MRAAVAGWLTLAAAWSAEAAPAARVHVDLSGIRHRIIHATSHVSVVPGPLTLVYPQWLPGDHGPTGPVTNLAGVFVRAGGRDLGWSRVPEDMYAMRVEVPEGVSEITIDLDYLMPPGPDGVPEGSSASDKLAILNWGQVLYMPKDAVPRTTEIRASLKLPAGWSFGTALRTASASGGEAAFEPVTMETLIDSPVLAGQYFRRITLDEHVFVEIAADAPADLELPSDLERAFRNLVKESDALFGPRPFRDYHFLIALSEHVSQFALEHHESSDNRLRERSFVDDDAKRLMAETLAHEYAHAWNGKFRRPAGLRPGDYVTPIDSSLVWVYEGLTQYLGWVLAARSGQLSVEDSLDTLAVVGADLETHHGRAWRDLEDTAKAAQLLYYSPTAWTGWRRGTDFYDEGLMVWLEADVTIRRLTKGAKSLDDFCRAFLGGGTGRAEVKAYVLGDVIAAMQSVVPYDWNAFFSERTRGRADHPPLGGIPAGGYALTFADTPSTFLEATQTLDETLDERYSLGLLLTASGEVADVVPGSKPWMAGIAPGMKIVAVNERRFGDDVLHDAIRAGSQGVAPLRLLVESADYFRTVEMTTEGGLKYPRLTRGTGEDVLSRILAPKAGKPYNKSGNTKKR